MSVRHSPINNYRPYTGQFATSDVSHDTQPQSPTIIMYYYCIVYTVYLYTCYTVYVLYCWGIAEAGVTV